MPKNQLLIEKQNNWDLKAVTQTFSKLCVTAFTETEFLSNVSACVIYACAYRFAVKTFEINKLNVINKLKAFISDWKTKETKTREETAFRP